VKALYVLPWGASEGDWVRAQHAVEESINGIRYPSLETKIVQAATRAGAILREAKDHDLIVIGATDEPLFKNFLVGTLPERIARDAQVTVMMVKRRSSPLHSFVRQALLEPTQPKPLEDD
jgi:APA family basic amino acid/polyamine antiporter